jgi:hypothetical protein
VSAESAGEVAFLPTLSGRQAGIELFISGQPLSGQFYYQASIDKLSPDQYAVNSYYLLDGKLSMFVQIDHSFTDGTVSIYRTSASRLLQTASPTLAGSFKVQRFDSLTAGEIDSVNSFSMVFSVSAWLGVVLVMVAVMLGMGVVT